MERSALTASGGNRSQAKEEGQDGSPDQQTYFGALLVCCEHAACQVRRWEGGEGKAGGGGGRFERITRSCHRYPCKHIARMCRLGPKWLCPLKGTRSRSSMSPSQHRPCAEGIPGHIHIRSLQKCSCIASCHPSCISRVIISSRCASNDSIVCV